MNSQTLPQSGELVAVSVDSLSRMVLLLDNYVTLMKYVQALDPTLAKEVELETRNIAYVLAEMAAQVA